MALIRRGEVSASGGRWRRWSGRCAASGWIDGSLGRVNLRFFVDDVISEMVNYGKKQVCEMFQYVIPAKAGMTWTAEILVYLVRILEGLIKLIFIGFEARYVDENAQK